MDVYDAYIQKKRLCIPQDRNRSLKSERELVGGVLGSQKEFVTSYFRMDGLDLLVVYSWPTFERIWDHLIHPKVYTEETDDLRRLLFPFSEPTTRDQYGHVNFDPNSVRNLYGLERSFDFMNLSERVSAMHYFDRLFVVKPGDIDNLRSSILKAGQSSERPKIQPAPQSQPIEKAFNKQADSAPKDFYAEACKLV